MEELALLLVSCAMAWTRRRFPPLPFALAICGGWESSPYISSGQHSRDSPEDMRAEELALPLAGCSTGWVSRSKAGELALVIWVWESWQAAQL